MESIEIELELTKLMQELQQNTIVLETALAPFTRLIENINNDIEQVSKPFNEKSVKIQKRITELALIRKESLKTGSGNITYVSGAVRRNWDLDALDEICDEDEYVKEKIWNLRDEKEGKPQVRINVETKGKSVIDI